MYAEERQERVAHLIESEGRVSVLDLASTFDVTAETVRRDLAQLESRGVVRRVHGGAVAPSRTSRLEESVSARTDRNAAAKSRIADAARTLLPSSFSGAVAVDAGTTTGLLAEHIARWRPDAAHRSLVIITNAVSIASIVGTNPDVEVQLLGGRLRGITGAAVGAATVAQLRGVRPDIAFLGANGVHADFGLSTPDQEEAAVKSAYVTAARRTVALVDDSKLGEEALMRFAALDELDTLITSAQPEDRLASALTDAEVEVMVA
ncbi:DeoR/GlpR family DNA-binding transcription regulator [Planctomonas psychrotolerans]|uniref:DeoR/GlpR family DNA-binding transcription regulator n=1 Tax=Planctomonas psychrotolerans TaxID=2528712 RepID=UPI00123AD48C|nr:DeoR/GlpR family DNA-binding transcription regulator [Planctomonas psychrotolerans]